jgi:hypothetical protein
MKSARWRPVHAVVRGCTVGRPLSGREREGDDHGAPSLYRAKTLRMA